MARAQLWAVFGGIFAVMSALTLVGIQWPWGLGYFLPGIVFSVRGWGRILQLTGHLRDPAPWERRRRPGR
jgi:hypothetical protein